MSGTCSDSWTARKTRPVRPRQPCQAVPGGGADPGHAGQAAVQVPEADGLDQPGYVSAQLPDSGLAPGFAARTGVDHSDQEDRGLGQRGDNFLRLDGLSGLSGLDGRNRRECLASLACAVNLATGGHPTIFPHS
jgi:hypothetical protein